MDTCIACGGRSIVNNGRIEGYIEGLHFDVLTCSDCKTKWSNPHSVDTPVYEYIYSNKNDTPGYIRYAQYAEDVTSYRNPISYLAKQEPAYYGVSVNLPKTGKVLEVGCGLGYFTYALNQSGYSAVGIDVSKEAIDDATKQYGPIFRHQDFFTLAAATEADKYDVIIMVELIEHVDNPRRYLEHARTLLRPNGVLIVTTPNRSWYPDEVLWASDLPPVHLTWFSEKGISSLANSVGFSATFTPYTTFNLLYGSILGPVPNPALNPPFFKADGTPLFGKFHHSKMYYFTRKYGLYKLLKKVALLVLKLKELPVVIKNPKRFSVKNSTCMTVVMKLN